MKRNFPPIELFPEGYRRRTEAQVECHHVMKLQGRTDMGWQYIFECEDCNTRWYPSVDCFGAVREFEVDPVPSREWWKWKCKW